MICIDELTATIKRLQLLKDNTDSPEEIVATDLMITNLTNLARQFNMLLDSPDFKQMVAEYKINSKLKDD
ncbi:MAG: hypothetical protein J6V44_11175 [Methanobrevibacter sp.]|nr:hypothetical protein [Methanobrevibacter sp.]